MLKKLLALTIASLLIGATVFASSNSYYDAVHVFVPPHGSCNGNLAVHETSPYYYEAFAATSCSGSFIGSAVEITLIHNTNGPGEEETVYVSRQSDYAEAELRYGTDQIEKVVSSHWHRRSGYVSMHYFGQAEVYPY